MKRMADKMRSEVSYNVDDCVFVDLKLYCQLSVSLLRNTKQGMKYFGPFKILQETGTMAYKLLLPPEAKILPVFHASLLKPCHGDPVTSLIPLALTTDARGPLIQPHSLLQSRAILRNGQLINQVLVQWDGLDAATIPWEDLHPL